MKKLLLLSLILGVVFTSCQSKKDKTFEGFEKSKTNLFYKFHIQNNGETPEMMELLDLQMECKINDTAVVIPNNRMILQMIEPMFEGDIYEGISMMHKGDSASFIVRTDSTFMTLFQLPTLPAEFSDKDIMRFDVKLNDFYPESEFAIKQIEYMKKTYKKETEESENELQKYFKENNLKPIKTETGLYYLKMNDGNGENPQVGTEVKVHYTGRLLDGTVFDSSIDRNEPLKFDLGVGQVIPGWDEGIQLMSKGEKGVLYIPYYLAYGDRYAGPIPPFSTLLFEVELVDF